MNNREKLIYQLIWKLSHSLVMLNQDNINDGKIVMTSDDGISINIHYDQRKNYVKEGMKKTFLKYNNKENEENLIIVRDMFTQKDIDYSLSKADEICTYLEEQFEQNKKDV